MARSRLEELQFGEAQGPGEVGVGPSEPGGANDPTVGQSAESEVAMDVYGTEQTTITEVIERTQTDEDPEPGAPSLEKLTPPPPLPKEIKIVEPDIQPIAEPLPTENPTAPTPEFLTEEIRTYTPVYSSLSAQIVEVVNRNTVKLDTDYNQQAQKIGVVEGDYQGTDPRARLTYDVTYPNFRVEDLKTSLHFDEDKTGLITNLQLDNTTVKDYPHSFVMKLDEPLNETVAKGDEL